VACDRCRWQNSGVKYIGDMLEDDDETRFVGRLWDDDERCDNRFMKSLRLRHTNGKKPIHMYSVTGG